MLLSHWVGYCLGTLSSLTPFKVRDGKTCGPSDVFGLQSAPTSMTQWSKMMRAIAQQYLERHQFPISALSKRARCGLQKTESVLEYPCPWARHPSCVGLAQK